MENIHRVIESSRGSLYAVRAAVKSVESFVHAKVEGISVAGVIVTATFSDQPTLGQRSTSSKEHEKRHQHAESDLRQEKQIEERRR